MYTATTSWASRGMRLLETSSHQVPFTISLYNYVKQQLSALFTHTVSFSFLVNTFMFLFILVYKKRIIVLYCNAQLGYIKSVLLIPCPLTLKSPQLQKRTISDFIDWEHNQSRKSTKVSQRIADHVAVIFLIIFLY